MTSRSRLLVAGALGLTAWLSLGAMAGAQTETTVAAPAEQEEPVAEAEGAAEGEVVYADKYAEECAHLILEGHDLEDCHYSPHKFRPETNEIIWGSFFFLVVAVLLAKMALPAMKKGMAARSDRIRSDLDRASAARSDAEAALVETRRQLDGSAEEGERIKAEGLEQARVLEADLRARADAEAAELRRRSEVDAGLSVGRATDEIRARVGALSVLVAEQLVERNLDASTQRALVESYIARVGSGAN
jgi:F-type H+-transporting ATPase subunit b